MGQRSFRVRERIEGVAVALRVCTTPGCGTLHDQGGRCTECRRTADRERGSRQERGYDAEHERTKTRLLPAAIGKPCPRCGNPMLSTDDLELGHTIDRALDPSARGDRIEHSSCNRRAGGQLVHQLRAT